MSEGALIVALLVLGLIATCIRHEYNKKKIEVNRKRIEVSELKQKIKTQNKEIKTLKNGGNQ